MKELLEIPYESVSGANRKEYGQLLNRLKQEGDLREIAKCSKYYAISVTKSGFSAVLSKAQAWLGAANDARNAGIKCWALYGQSADFYAQISDNENAAEMYKIAAVQGVEEKIPKPIIREYYKKSRLQYEASGDNQVASRIYIIENDLKLSEATGQEKISLLFLKVFCGYGEKPRLILAWGGFSIIICSIIYFLCGIKSEGVINNSYWSSLYFSVVTFTTLGYGDYAPAGLITRIIAALQALSGLFFTSFFLATYIKKYSR